LRNERGQPNEDAGLAIDRRALRIANDASIQPFQRVR